MKKAGFNYQDKIWGGSQIRLKPTYLAYLRLKYALTDLKKVSGRVLDAGCGGGSFAGAIEFYRPDLEVYGVDISRKAVKQAEKNFQKVKFKAGNLYGLPYRDNFFDAVIVEDVLEHLGRPKDAVKEISRVLRKDGLFHTFVPLEGEWYSLHFWLNKVGWKAKLDLAGHIQKFKLSELEKMLLNAGFRARKKRFSVHLLGQFVDVLYFIFLKSISKRLDAGLEEALIRKPLLNVFKEIITLFTNIESLFFPFLPGAGVHIICRKIN